MDALRTDKDRRERDRERELHKREMVGGLLKRRREWNKSKGVRKKLMMGGETEWEIHEEQKAVMGESLICKWDCPWWPFSPPVHSFFFPSQTSMLCRTQVSILSCASADSEKRRHWRESGLGGALSCFPLTHAVPSRDLALRPSKQGRPERAL